MRQAIATVWTRCPCGLARSICWRCGGLDVDERDTLCDSRNAHSLAQEAGRGPPFRGEKAGAPTLDGSGGPPPGPLAGPVAGDRAPG